MADIQNIKCKNQRKTSPNRRNCTHDYSFERLLLHDRSLKEKTHLYLILGGWRGNWWIGRSSDFAPRGEPTKFSRRIPIVAAWRESLKTHVLSLLSRSDLTRPVGNIPICSFKNGNRNMGGWWGKVGEMHILCRLPAFHSLTWILTSLSLSTLRPSILSTKC